MSLKFGWYKTPVPEGREDKKLSHARIVSQGTLNTRYLCDRISSSCTLSSADVKGALEALNFWMGFYLSEGNSIELDGLGYFSPTLKSHVVADGKGREKIVTQADSIGFRCCTTLKKTVRKAGLEEVKKTKEIFPPDRRKENTLQYVKENLSINRSSCISINQCTRYIAMADLKELIDQNKLIQTGEGRQVLYIRPY